MSEENEKYFSLALHVARNVLRNRERAVLWWKEEQPHMIKYHLTADQRDQISSILAERFPREGA